MIKKNSLKKKNGRIDAIVSYEEKKKLDLYLVKKDKSLVGWIKEKIKEISDEDDTKRYCRVG